MQIIFILHIQSSTSKVVTGREVQNNCINPAKLSIIMVTLTWLLLENFID
jgi:hypothetical protein